MVDDVINSDERSDDVTDVSEIARKWRRGEAVQITAMCRGVAENL